MSLSTLRKRAILAGLVAVAIIACGDDDPARPDPALPDAGSLPESGPPGDTGAPDGDRDGPTTFPAYVQTLIETKTSDTALPDPESAWGALADDEKHVYPPTFF
ncbi:MAG: hypothetical protein KF819_30400 [Labilithrix sp.]|nr:hypothetical protein [Labilithrix sp.]